MRKSPSAGDFGTPQLRVESWSVASNAALARAIHDLQARLGSIRIAVTAVAGLDLDEETRREMLTSASEESVRASAELTAIGALATCLLDPAPASECDVREAAQSAAATARLGGLDVYVHDDDNVTAPVDPERMALVLASLMRVVGGAGTEVRVRVGAHGVVLDGNDTEAVPAIAYALAEQLGSPAIAFGKIE